MKTVRGALIVILAGLVSLAILAEAGRADGSRRAERIAEALKNVKITLDDAVKAATAQVQGTAIKAELEVEPDEVAFEVVILVAGDKPKLVEVEVDPVSGKILEVEDEDEEDEAHEDDDKDDDDKKGGKDDG